MSTKQYKDIDEAYQCLTDEEIEDDSREQSCAVIPILNIQEVKIKMLCEYHYFYILIPLRDKIFNYFLNNVEVSKKLIELELLTKQMTTLVEDLSEMKTKEDVEKKAGELLYLFSPEEVRKEFFQGMKDMEILNKSITWEKWIMNVKPWYMPLIFCYLWLFNFNGVKKKIQILLDKLIRITADTSSQSPIGFNGSTNWDSWKENYMKAHDRVIKKEQEAQLDNSKN